MERFLESCCTSLEQAVEAQRRGASRIELCEELSVGGVTPSNELLEAVVEAVDIPVNVLVRPRGGDFVFSEDEIRQMEASIRDCKRLGAAGVVIGALDAAGNVDMPTMRRLVGLARELGGLTITFHRAFDVCADPHEAFERVLELGCDRLLTSGHEPDAFQGRFLIAELVEKAGDRLIVMAGCGVRPSNVAEIETVTKAKEYHASFTYFVINFF